MMFIYAGYGVLFKTGMTGSVIGGPVPCTGRIHCFVKLVETAEFRLNLPFVRMYILLFLYYLNRVVVPMQ